MAWATNPVTFDSQRIAFRTMRAAEIPEIAASIFEPDGWYQRLWGISSTTDCEARLIKQIVDHRRGNIHPLVYRTAGEVAGITRLMRLEPANKSLEIGGTWVAPRWRRTFVNTEVKLRVLEHCFETLGAIRVEFRVHVDNKISQTAVTRLGATLEGRLRHRQIAADGCISDGFIYSVIEPEWAAIKLRLTALARFNEENAQ